MTEKAKVLRKPGRLKSVKGPCENAERINDPSVEQSFLMEHSINIGASIYNRANALAFARTFWDVVCPDLCIGINAKPFVKQVPRGTVFQRFNSGPPEAAVGPDGRTILQFAEMEDCSHFVSSCLGTPPNATGGGLYIPSDFAVAYGIFGAQRLFDHLSNSGYLNVIGTNLEHDNAAAKLNGLAAGDLVFYAAKGRPYRHGALFLGGRSNKIACHTYCRADQTPDGPPQDWDSVGFRDDNTGSMLVTVYTLAQVR